MSADFDIAWAAGLFEGEGCISMRTRITKRGSAIIAATLVMDTTDEDVLRRFASIVGGNVRGPFAKVGGHKLVWAWQISKRSEAQRILRLLRPYLGQRRGAKADLMQALPPAHPRKVLELVG